MTESLVGLAWWEVFLAGVSTLAIYSFLVRENPVYRLFEHFFIGIAAGWGMVKTVTNFLWPQILKPMLGMDQIPFPDGSFATERDPLLLLYLLPMAFGMLYYCIYSRRWRWLAQMVIGMQFGYAGGLAFKGTFTELLPQVFNSFKPLWVPNDVGQTLTNWFFMFTLLSVFSYFFFTFRRGTSGVQRFTMVSGRWLMMGCFGAFFGSTIMARMALLVERLHFLINTWGPALW
jgi:hypothetical protein